MIKLRKCLSPVWGGDRVGMGWGWGWGGGRVRFLLSLRIGLSRSITLLCNVYITSVVLYNVYITSVVILTQQFHIEN